MRLPLRKGAAGKKAPSAIKSRDIAAAKQKLAALRHTTDNHLRREEGKRRSQRQIEHDEYDDDFEKSDDSESDEEIF